VPEPVALNYSAEPPSAYRIEPLVDAAMLFHRASGNTHFLFSPAIEILELLGAEAMPIERLTELLAARLDAPCDEEARMVVETRLAELAGAGLVQAA
jgi:PqqD family protein of HPr-rel-A system